MPRNKTSVQDLGTICAHGTEFRAHIQFRGDAGEKKHIYGPSRSRNEAQKDLDQIRVAGGVGATREEGIKLMEAEAIRIKKLTEYQSEIQQTIERMASRDIVDDSDCTDNDDMSDHSIPDWMKEYPSEDDSPGETSQSTRITLTPMEATAELTRFRPIHGTPSDLKYLLECKADPNMPLKDGDISPLRKVMSFATERYVTQMRDLLLQYGAFETDADRERWMLRQRADVAEQIMKNNYKNIDKDYNPWSANERDF